jgi:hypothetical protein
VPETLTAGNRTTVHITTDPDWPKDERVATAGLGEEFYTEL